jgi:hypothetical protein
MLSDVPVHDLDIVFCGTAAGAVSARQRGYYAILAGTGPVALRAR